jgi:hypothetical protein
MVGRTRGWKGALAALAMLPTVSGVGGPVASAAVAPTSGYPGARLVATYSFTPKSSCSAYHQQVTWSFGNTKNWATSAAPSTSGTRCTSSTPSTAPPRSLSPGEYMICGTDTSVSSNAACATYTIKASTPPPAPSPSPSAKPTPKASPLPSRSPLPSSSPPSSPSPGAHSPDASPGGPPPGGISGSGPNAFEPTGSTGVIQGWPWIALIAFLAVIGAAWRFRSWLIGVFENVEVLGRSGADLEAELLHHESSPPFVDIDPPPPTEE